MDGAVGEPGGSVTLRACHPERLPLEPAGLLQPVLRVEAEEEPRELPPQESRLILGQETPALQPAKASGWGRRVAFAASLSVHLALGYFFIRHVTLPGATEQPSEAISVELAPTEVLEAVDSSPAEEAAASASPSANAETEGPVAEPTEAAADKSQPVEEPREARASEQASVAQEEQKQRTAEPQPPQEEQARAAPEPVAQPEETFSARAEPAPPEPVAREDGLQPPEEAPVKKEEAAPPPAQTEAKEAKEIKKKPEVKETPRRQTARELGKRRRETAAKEGKREKENQSSRRSASARGAAGSAPSGRVSAMAGSTLDYAAMVRARIASNRPGGGARGTTAVSFGVTASGGLRFVRLARSSGNGGLDQAAMNAVRRASPFPPPPTGAPTTFTIPFNFR